MLVVCVLKRYEAVLKLRDYFLKNVMKPHPLIII